MTHQKAQKAMQKSNEHIMKAHTLAAQAMEHMTSMMTGSEKNKSAKVVKADKSAKLAKDGMTKSKESPKTPKKDPQKYKSPKRKITK
jgi:hypothetical protein